MNLYWKTGGLLLETIRLDLAYWSKQSPLFGEFEVRVSGLKNNGPILGAAAIFNNRNKANGQPGLK